MKDRQYKSYKQPYIRIICTGVFYTGILYLGILYTGLAMPALAHYEFPNDSLDASPSDKSNSTKSKKSKHKSTTQTKAANQASLDPWKLLEFAITPADAANSQTQIYTDESYRYVRSNGIPDHTIGAFPNPGNPNYVSEQDYFFRMPKNPEISTRETSLGMFPFGVAINGVPFDPGANGYWNGDRYSGWQYEPMALAGRMGMDMNNAHVQPNGAYHYHGMPTGLLDQLGTNKPVLVGFAADGFPIYGPWAYSDAKNKNASMKKLHSSYRVKSGTRPNGPQGTYDGTFVQDYEFVPGLGDLDECNGRSGVTPEYPSGTYYYVLTENFPFIPRIFKGQPDQSFRTHGGTMRRPPGGIGPGGGPPGREGPPGGGGPPPGEFPQGGPPPFGPS